MEYYYCAATEPQWGEYHCSKALPGIGQCTACAKYQQGIEPFHKPHYPVPALADTVTVTFLSHYDLNCSKYAWDNIWRTEDEMKVLRYPVST